jgi:hypothetical protein
MAKAASEVAVGREEEEEEEEEKQCLDADARLNVRVLPQPMKRMALKW